MTEKISHIVEQVAGKLEQGKELALPKTEVEKAMHELMVLQANFLSERIDRSELDRLTPDVTNKFIKSLVQFDTISEFSQALQLLVKENFIDRETANFVLSHENDHALPVLIAGVDDIKYGLIFVKDENGSVSGFQPLMISNTMTLPKNDARAVTKRSVGAPEMLSPGDRIQLGFDSK